VDDGSWSFRSVTSQTDETTYAFGDRIAVHLSASQAKALNCLRRALPWKSIAAAFLFIALPGNLFQLLTVSLRSAK
jgi:hypothetical protein